MGTSKTRRSPAKYSVSWRDAAAITGWVGSSVVSLGHGTRPFGGSSGQSTARSPASDATSVRVPTGVGSVVVAYAFIGPCPFGRSGKRSPKVVEGVGAPRPPRVGADGG